MPYPVVLPSHMCYWIVTDILEKSTYTRLIWDKQIRPFIQKTLVLIRFNSGWKFKLCKLNNMENITPFMTNQLVNSIVKRYSKADDMYHLL